MLFKYQLFLICCLAAFGTLSAEKRASSAPYISGDSFRFASDFTYDDIDKSMDPSKVSDGSTVFVKTDYLEEFFSIVHPKIPSRYILITHNSDDPIPGNFSHMVEDDRIIAWFGHNVENFSHEKLYPIPMGIANQCWRHGNTKILSKARKSVGKAKKKYLVYMNFSKSTHPTERNFVFNLFNNKKYCHKSKPKGYVQYLQDLNMSKFVLSPRGNGLDCHRTWETLYMGSIPIVKSSAIDSLFDDLPVLVINDWKEITPSFLEQKHQEIERKTYLSEKLYINYWLGLIASKKP